MPRKQVNLITSSRQQMVDYNQKDIQEWCVNKNLTQIFGIQQHGLNLFQPNFQHHGKWDLTLISLPTPQA